MTNRRWVAVALVAVGAVAVVVGVVKLLSRFLVRRRRRRHGIARERDRRRRARDRSVPRAHRGAARGRRSLHAHGDRRLARRARRGAAPGRRDLGDYDGMLFVFDGATDVGFTMSTVPVPLDIGFYDADGNLVSTRRMKPCAEVEDECPVVPIRRAVRLRARDAEGRAPLRQRSRPAVVIRGDRTVATLDSCHSPLVRSLSIDHVGVALLASTGFGLPALGRTGSNRILRPQPPARSHGRPQHELRSEGGTGP